MLFGGLEIGKVELMNWVSFLTSVKVGKFNSIFIVWFASFDIETYPLYSKMNVLQVSYC